MRKTVYHSDFIPASHNWIWWRNDYTQKHTYKTTNAERIVLLKNLKSIRGWNIIEVLPTWVSISLKRFILTSIGVMAGAGLWLTGDSREITWALLPWGYPPSAAVGALRGYKTHEKQSAQQTWLSSGGWHPPSGFLYLFLGTGEMYLNPPSSVWWVSGPASVEGKVETSPTQLPYSVPHLIHLVILWGKYDPHSQMKRLSFTLMNLL